MTEAGTKRSEDFHRSERLVVEEANAVLAEIKKWAKNHGALVEPSESSWADGQGVKISKDGAFVQIEGGTNWSLGKENGEIGKFRELVVKTHSDDTVQRLLRDPKDGWRRFRVEGVLKRTPSSSELFDDAIWDRVPHLWGWFEALLNKVFRSAN